MIKRLPDSEFEIMDIIWASAPPITTVQIVDKMDPKRILKMQTVLTMLVRLVEKGFLTSERVGRERIYSPIISKQDYMQIEIGNFMARHYINSMGGFIKTFYDGQVLSAEDIKELEGWLAEKGVK